MGLTAGFSPHQRDEGHTLPPLGRGGSAPAAAPAPHRGSPLIRAGGSRDCGSMAAPLAECSEGMLAVSRSGHSGSSRLGGGGGGGSSSRLFANDFHWTLHSRDLPLDVRPIVEDNKMLQEELRRYRQRVGDQESTISSQDRQIVALRDELLRAQQQIKQCSITPEQLMGEQQLRQMLQERDASLRQLQHKAAIMEKAKDAAERRLRNDLAAERRQQAELKRRIKQLQEEVEEKQKQSRFNQLHINQLYKRLEPLEAAVAAAAAPPPLPPPPPPAPEPEERVHLMLCCIYAQPQPTAREIAEAAARLALEEQARQAAALRAQQAAAAQAIQAAFRGFMVRRRLAALHSAATAIQACWRGALARRALAPLLHQRQYESLSEQQRLEASLSPAERLAQRRQAAERRYVDRAAAGGVKPQKRLPQRHSISSGSARSANTAPEAAARKRSMLLAAAGASDGSSSSSSSSGAGRGGMSAGGSASNGSSGGSAVGGSGHAQALVGAGSSSSGGSSIAARRPSSLGAAAPRRGSTAGLTRLELPSAAAGEQAGDGRSPPPRHGHEREQTGAGRTSERGSRGSILRQPVASGFGSSQEQRPRQSILGGLS